MLLVFFFGHHSDKISCYIASKHVPNKSKWKWERTHTRTTFSEQASHHSNYKALETIFFLDQTSSYFFDLLYVLKSADKRGTSSSSNNFEGADEKNIIHISSFCLRRHLSTQARNVPSGLIFTFLKLQWAIHWGYTTLLRHVVVIRGSYFFFGFTQVVETFLTVDCLRNWVFTGHF